MIGARSRFVCAGIASGLVMMAVASALAHEHDVLVGRDLDQEFSRFESSQNFSLVDAGAWRGEVTMPGGAATARTLEGVANTVCGPTGDPLCRILSFQDVTERKAVEAALRSTAADLAKAQHIARVGSWRWTAADGSVQWSPEMFRILGLDPSERPVPYHEQDRIFLPASWSRLQDARQAALVHGTPYEVELEGRRGDGSIGWFMARGEIARDGAGRTTGIFGTLQDITDHKRAEAEMRTVRDQLRELSSHHEDVLNEERKSIALDVHDELGQMLTAMKLQLDLLQSQLNDPRAAAAAADKLRALIGDTIEVTRNVALNLRPAALDFGLVPALEWLAEDFTLRSELLCSIDACAGEVILGEKAAIELFRIAQESLTNVARHAGATRVLLTMQRLDDRLCLSIRDDGCGFGPQDVDRIGHFGLLGMRERALRLGAELRVDSQPGRGTTVSVLLPARPGGQEPFDRESP